MTHTPTPWAISPRNPCEIVYFEDGDPPDDPWYIAVITKDAPGSDDGEGSENTKFIVTAVNSHDDMLEALEAAHKYLQPELTEPGRTVFWKVADAIKKGKNNA